MSLPDVAGILRLSRAYAAKNLPWFAPALYRCHMIMSEQVDVAAIDVHYNVYWNPSVVELIQNSTNDKERALQELAFIWIHEISHNLRDHSTRSSDLKADKERWNCCTDLEINDADWPGTRKPTLFPPLLPAQFKLPNGKLAEWYYQQQATTEQALHQVDCGSAAHGQARPWELCPDKQHLNNTQVQVIRRQVALEMSNQAPGTLPGSWKVWVQHTLKPKIDWRKVLKQRLATAIALGSGSRVDYSFRRPARKQAAYAPVIIPVLTGSASGQLAVVIDTSGSMIGQPLEQAVAELYGIMRQAHQQVTLIPCDAASYAPVLLRTAADLKAMLELPGGGGTDMRVGIQSAMTLCPEPDTILVLTDGYTPYPYEKVKLPVVFGILTQKGQTLSKPPNPPWGDDTVVEIEIG